MAKRLSAERANQIIEVWKTIVSVQQHFNDIGMRIRSMFVALLLALFASIGFLLDKRLTIAIGIVNVQFATLIPLFGVFGAMLFYFIDRYWYHRLLVGSVNHAIEIEKEYEQELPELSLSDHIGKESPYTPTGIVWAAAKLLVTDDRFRKDGRLHSDGKIELFYKSIMLVLVCTTGLLAIFGGVRTP
jgi:hypothetical protein